MTLKLSLFRSLSCFILLSLFGSLWVIDPLLARTVSFKTPCSVLLLLFLFLQCFLFPVVVCSGSFCLFFRSLTFVFRLFHDIMTPLSQGNPQGLWRRGSRRPSRRGVARWAGVGGRGCCEERCGGLQRRGMML